MHDHETTFEIELVPSNWLQFRPAILLAELIELDPWQGSRHRPDDLIKAIDALCVRADAGSLPHILWNGITTNCIELLTTKDGQLIESCRVRFDCRRFNETLFEVVGVIAMRFELSAVSAEGQLAKVNPMSLISAAFISGAAMRARTIGR
jgi:hypothetical protein